VRPLLGYLFFLMTWCAWCISS